MRRHAVIALTLALAGVICTVVTRGSAGRAFARADAQARATAGRVTAVIASEAAARELRATGLGSLPAVRAAVETDAATVRDMARVEGFVFRLARGETIELYQRPAHERPLTLLRLPANAAPLALPSAGARLSSRAGAWQLTTTVLVSPLYPHGSVEGAIAVAAPLDGRALAAAMAPEGDERDDGGQARLDDGTAAGADGAVARAPVHPPDGVVGATPLIVVVPVVRGGGVARWIGRALLVAALTFALVALLALRGPRASALVNAPRVVPEAVTAREKLNDAPSAAEAARLVLAWSSDAPTPISQLAPNAELAAVDVHPRAERLATRYRILSTIGRGHRADVYLAQSLVPGTPSTVALKLLDEMPADERGRYLDAARRQAGIAHPHVIAVYDVDDGEVAYVAMEYLEGCTAEALLRDLVARDEPLPLGEVLTLAGALCCALDVALIHGAVKPSNLLVGRHDAVKLGDFGAPPSPTDRHAPEQYAGRPADRRSDIYTVGVLLHELVTGRTMASAVGDPRRWPPLPAPSTLRPGLPRAVDAVIARATRFGPRGRYASAGALFADLVRASNEAAPLVGGLGDWVERARRFS
ncbi:MAG TPA: serine/threonine-protein kinase [Polyangia bacterium]